MKKTLLATIALCTTLGSCTTEKETKAIAPEALHGEWLITKAGDLATDKASQAPFINFTDSGTINGYSAANDFFGYYTTSGDSLYFNQVAVTFMLGSDEDMNIEAAIMHAINSGKTFEMADSVLHLKDADGKLIMTMERE